MSQKITIGRILRRSKKKLKKKYRRFRRNKGLRFTLGFIIGVGAVVFLSLKYINSQPEETMGNNTGSTGSFYSNDGEIMTPPTDVHGNEIKIDEDVVVKKPEDLDKYIYPESTITSLATEIESDPTELYVLVNKENPVDKYYVPDDLVEPDVEFNFDEEDEKRYLRKDAARALENMFADAADQGHKLQAVSGYRSYTRQYVLYTRNLKYRGLEYTSLYSAMPGRSEHQTGWAMDITCDSVDNVLSVDFGNTAEGEWVNENCYKYGFIVRYQKDKVDITGYAYEPWHLRYVGYDLAKYLYDNDLTLDEYYSYKLNKELVDEQERDYYVKNIKGAVLPTIDPSVIVDDPSGITDIPMNPIESDTPSVNDTKEPANTADANVTVSPTKEPETTKSPSKAPEVSKTPEPEKSQTPAPTKTPEKTKAPEATASVKPDATASTKPVVSESAQPSMTAIATDEPPTKTPDVTKTPKPTKAPDVTKTPKPTKTPDVTEEPTAEPATTQVASEDE